MGPALARLLLTLPTRQSGPTRRELLAIAAGSAPLVLLGCRAPSRQPPAPQAPVDAGAPFVAAPPRPPAGRLLSEAEWRTYELAFSRILPSIDGPGAREANVIAFLDGQLATRTLAPVLPLVRMGAALLDGWAQRSQGRPFCELAPAQADSILDELAHGRIPATGVPQQPLFAALVELALEGFLSDPIHGGNHDMCGWRTIGFPEPHRRTPGPVDSAAHAGHAQHAAGSTAPPSPPSPVPSPPPSPSGSAK